MISTNSRISKTPWNSYTVLVEVYPEKTTGWVRDYRRTRVLLIYFQGKRRGSSASFTLRETRTVPATGMHSLLGDRVSLPAPNSPTPHQRNKRREILSGIWRTTVNFNRTVRNLPHKKASSQIRGIKTQPRGASSKSTVSPTSKRFRMPRLSDDSKMAKTKSKMPQYTQTHLMLQRIRCFSTARRGIFRTAPIRSTGISLSSKIA